MTIVRHYTIDANEGHESEVETALLSLVDLARQTDGCSGIELLRDLHNRSRFIFVEKWESVEAHKSAVNPQASALLAQILPLFVGRPAAAYCDWLKSV